MVQSIEFAPAVRRRPFQLGKQVTLFILLMFFYLLGCAGEIHAKWYRYYDSRGTANISANVTPAHIRYGYESLDQNMQVIAKTPAWNGDRDAKLKPDMNHKHDNNNMISNSNVPMATVKLPP